MDTKPGIKTTEFWIAAVANLVPLLVLTGVVAPDQADVVTENANGAISGIFLAVTSIGAAIASFGYSYSRGKAKSGK